MSSTDQIDKLLPAKPLLSRWWVIWSGAIVLALLNSGLGYMNWFSSISGRHTVYFSWGHGGQHIFLLHELNMIIITTADYMPGQDGDEAWQKQKSITDMVGKYISKLR